MNSSILKKAFFLFIIISAPLFINAENKKTNSAELNSSNNTAIADSLLNDSTLNDTIIIDTAILAFEDTIYNLGLIDRLEKDQDLEYTFNFCNAGVKDLLINRILSTRFCKVMEFSTDTIKPDQAGYIRLKIDKNKVFGKFNKSIYVYSNLPTKKLELSGILELIDDSEIIEQNTEDDWYKDEDIENEDDQYSEEKNQDNELFDGDEFEGNEFDEDIDEKDEDEDEFDEDEAEFEKDLNDDYEE